MSAKRADAPSRRRRPAPAAVTTAPASVHPAAAERSLRVCFVTSECVPWVKTGGLADVSGALPRALAGLGVDVSIILPLYGSIDTAAAGIVPVPELSNIPAQLGTRTVPFSVWRGSLPGSPVTAWFIDCPVYFHRGHPYTSDADEHERFILFQQAVLMLLQRQGAAPDILHCNDWPTGLLPAWLRGPWAWDALFAKTRTVLTIHNIGYQGRFAADAAREAGFPEGWFAPMSPLEFHGSFSFLKTGLMYADVLSTVSPTYAREIQTPAYGYGLEGVLAQRSSDLAGVLNGIDPGEWHPASDPLIPQRYDSGTLELRARNRRALLERMKLPDDGAPVIGIVSRFAEQKGFALLMPIFEQILQRGVRFTVLGSGDVRLEEFFAHQAAIHPEHVAVFLGYNNELAHLITAGADLFLMPSLYEPCGLNQMYSLAYGCLPVVRRTGGLADTVLDADASPVDGNGFTFDEVSPAALLDAIERALRAWEDPALRRTLQQRGMNADHSWTHSATEYLALYDRALRGGRPHP